jgi:2,3-bisphosphoglycerate-dependent phosphoglycerate mutase
MQKKVIIVRHGDVENPKGILYGRSIEVLLSEKGKSQISSLAEKIASTGIPVKKIHTSTLKRAIQTAEILAQTLSAPIIHNSQLVDIHIPALAGKPVEIRKRIHEKGTDEYRGRWVKKGNEPVGEIVSRVLTAFTQIISAETEVPLIVSHGDPIIFLLYILENPGKRIPPVGKIIDMGYRIEKGQGFILTLDDSGKPISKELIS